MLNPNPSFAVYDLPDNFPFLFELGSYLSNRFSLPEKFPHCKNLFSFEFGMLFSPSSFSPALAQTIAGVVRWRAFKKMMRVHAHWIVALVTAVLVVWNLSKRENERHSMRGISGVVCIERSVSSFPCSEPWPTFFSRQEFNPGPKAFLNPLRVTSLGVNHFQNLEHSLRKVNI